MKYQDGVTLIELLLVIGIMAILAALSSPFLSGYILRTNLDTSTSMIISSIRKAQNYTIENKNNAPWGVCQSGGNIKLFSGSCQSSLFDEIYKLPNGVSVTGLTGVTFSRLRGEPSSSVNITISTSIGSRTIDVNAAGGMTIN